MFAAIAASALLCAVIIGSSCKGTGPEDKCAGITTLTLISPKPGDEFQNGSKMTIEWCYGNDFADAGVTIDASTNNGISFPIAITESEMVAKPKTSFQWTIPSNLAGQKILIKVAAYNLPEINSVTSSPGVTIK
jgi:hypothetical protein